MDVTVCKYGGTSVADSARIRTIAAQVAAANRDGSFRSLLYDANPSISPGDIPASSHARKIASIASLNSASGDRPRL